MTQLAKNKEPMIISSATDFESIDFDSLKDQDQVFFLRNVYIHGNKVYKEKPGINDSQKEALKSDLPQNSPTFENPSTLIEKLREGDIFTRGEASRTAESSSGESFHDGKANTNEIDTKNAPPSSLMNTDRDPIQKIFLSKNDESDSGTHFDEFAADFHQEEKAPKLHISLNEALAILRLAGNQEHTMNDLDAAVVQLLYEDPVNIEKYKQAYFNVREHAKTPKCLPPESSPDCKIETLQQEELRVTYWAKIETDRKRLNLQILDENVSGPEKKIITTMMPSCWKILLKKFGNDVGVWDAYDMAREMHENQQ